MPFPARTLSVRLLALATLAVSAPSLRAQTSPAADLIHVCSMRPVNDAVIGACRGAVRADPRNAAAHRAHGDAWASIERHKDALRAYEDALRLEPDSADAHLRVAQELDRLGRDGDALSEYREFVRRRPLEPRAHEIVGWLLVELKQMDEALAAFREAERLDAARGPAHQGAAVALAALNRHEEAVREFRVALQTTPNDPSLWGALAVSSAGLGRTDDAVAEWEHALQIDPAYLDKHPQERSMWEQAMTIAGPRRAASIDSTAPDTSRRVAVAPIRAHKPLLAASATSTGSGVVVSHDGDILTNKHVVRGCVEIKVRTDSGVSQAARLVAVDGNDDLAIIRPDSPLPHVAAFRGLPAIRPGDDVVAIGYPLMGLLASEPSVSIGTVNAMAGLYNDNHLLQMSAPVQHGSSGGPLLDSSGNIIGIVVTKLNAKVVAEETGDIPQNVNFAVKGTVAQKFLDGQGVRYTTAPATIRRSNADVGDIGRGVTVVVECWK
ncbi:MAG: hypothetical protein NVS4B3_13040 [Gemmatimonadaceae bacterium]